MRPSEIHIDFSIDQQNLTGFLNENLKRLLEIQPTFGNGRLKVRFSSITLKEIYVHGMEIRSSIELNISRLEMAGLIDWKNPLLADCVLSTTFHIDPNIQISSFTQLNSISVRMTDLENGRILKGLKPQIVKSMVNLFKGKFETKIDGAISKWLLDSKVVEQLYYTSNNLIKELDHHTNFKILPREIYGSGAVTEELVTSFSLKLICNPELSITRDLPEVIDNNGKDLTWISRQVEEQKTLFHPRILVDYTFLEDILIRRLTSTELPVIGKVSVENIKIQHENNLLVVDISTTGGVTEDIKLYGSFKLNEGEDSIEFDVTSFKVLSSSLQATLINKVFAKNIKRKITEASRAKISEIKKFLQFELIKFRRKMRNEKGIDIRIQLHDFDIAHMRICDEYLEVLPLLEFVIELHVFNVNKFLGSIHNPMHK